MAQIPTQAVIICVLLGLLLAWMVTFTVLALRSHPQNAEWPDEFPTPAKSFPVTHALTQAHTLGQTHGHTVEHTLAQTHASMTLQMIATPQLNTQLTQSNQDASEISTFPLASPSQL